MEIFALILLFLVLTAGLISLIFSLPGTWVILAGTAVFDWIMGSPAIGWGLLGTLLLLAALGEVLEFISGVLGAKRYAASRPAVVGAFIGGILGAIFGAGFGLGLGAIPGALLGAFGGAFAVEYARDQEFRQAWRSGLGALIGRMLGLVGKFAIAFVMILLIIGALF